jgi:hypothetical protein
MAGSRRVFAGMLGLGCVAFVVVVSGGAVGPVTPSAFAMGDGGGGRGDEDRGNTILNWSNPRIPSAKADPSKSPGVPAPGDKPTVSKSDAEKADVPGARIPAD